MVAVVFLFNEQGTSGTFLYHIVNLLFISLADICLQARVNRNHSDTKVNRNGAGRSVSHKLGIVLVLNGLGTTTILGFDIIQQGTVHNQFPAPIFGQYIGKGVSHRHVHVTVHLLGIHRGTTAIRCPRKTDNDFMEINGFADGIIIIQFRWPISIILFNSFSDTLRKKRRIFIANVSNDPFSTKKGMTVGFHFHGVKYLTRSPHVSFVHRNGRRIGHHGGGRFFQGCHAIFHFLFDRLLDGLSCRVIVRF
mmetsp:Transcript_27913/g.58451  ORF Transcript_27913/g.58451 Transcript_27913/m.58451 type:complete len:250 (+) Transcript_27913:136-885(+)